jgi:TolB-like protein/Tfp pilus assembly protein PilF
MGGKAILRFGPFRLDQALGAVLLPDGSQAALRPKTAELLALLLRHAGRPLTRAEILDAVWPGIFVTDDSITQCVVEIRRALGAEGAALLRTLPRRGYLLDAAVAEEPAAPPALAPAAATPAPASVPAAASAIAHGCVPVVAALPLRRLPPDPALDLFAEGLVEGLVGALAALREPVVISANSTRHLAGQEAELPAIARRLGADYIACGSLRRMGERIRLSVELAEGTRGAVVWTRSYDVAPPMLFEMQDSLAAMIANTLVPRLQEAERRLAMRRAPQDIGAYHLLLEARQLVFRMERDSFETAGALLRRAVAQDPGFASAHAALADWYSLRVGQGWSPDVAADAAALDAAVQAALALDSEHARALAIRGHNRTILQRDYAGALACFDRALDAAPNDSETWMWSAPTHAFLGDPGEAVRRAERAIALSPEDPLLFRHEHFLSIAHYAGGDYAAAAHWGARSLRANPHYTSALRTTAASLAALGQCAEARELAAKVLAQEPAFRIAPLIARQPFRDAAMRDRYARQLAEAGLPP